MMSEVWKHGKFLRWVSWFYKWPLRVSYHYGKGADYSIDNVIFSIYDISWENTDIKLNFHGFTGKIAPQKISLRVLNCFLWQKFNSWERHEFSLKHLFPKRIHEIRPCIVLLVCAKVKLWSFRAVCSAISDLIMYHLTWISYDFVVCWVRHVLETKCYSNQNSCFVTVENRTWLNCTVVYWQQLRT